MALSTNALSSRDGLFLIRQSFSDRHSPRLANVFDAVTAIQSVIWPDSRVHQLRVVALVSQGRLEITRT